MSGHTGPIAARALRSRGVRISDCAEAGPNVSIWSSPGHNGRTAMFRLMALAAVLYLVYYVLGHNTVSQGAFALTLGGAFVATVIFGLLKDA